MTSKQLKETIKKLKYFTANLVLIKDKIDNISAGEVSKQKRFFKETVIVNKLIAVHYYKILNKETLYSPEDFKFLLTKKETEGNNDMNVYFPKIEKRFLRMTPEEFNTYLEAYNELIIL